MGHSNPSRSQIDSPAAIALSGDNDILFTHGLRGHPRHTREDAPASGRDQNAATLDKRKTFLSLLQLKSVSAADNEGRFCSAETVLARDIQTRLRGCRTPNLYCAP